MESCSRYWSAPPAPMPDDLKSSRVIAQQHEVPVLIRELEDRDAMEIGLIENIQRQDLTPIEEAEGYQRLIKDFEHTQDELAMVVGKSRSHITNTLRLLTLPESVQHWVHENTLSAGHARALVGLENAEDLAKAVIAKGWSVRELERHVAAQKHPEMAERLAAQRAPRPVAGAALVEKDPDVLALEAEMSNIVGLKVDIQSKGEGSGTVMLFYNTLDQLDGLLQTLTRGAKH